MPQCPRVVINTCSRAVVAQVATPADQLAPCLAQAYGRNYKPRCALGVRSWAACETGQQAGTCVLRAAKGQLPHTCGACRCTWPALNLQLQSRDACGVRACALRCLLCQASKRCMRYAVSVPCI